MRRVCLCVCVWRRTEAIAARAFVLYLLSQGNNNRNIIITGTSARREQMKSVERKRATGGHVPQILLRFISQFIRYKQLIICIGVNKYVCVCVFSKASGKRASMHTTLGCREIEEYTAIFSYSATAIDSVGFAVATLVSNGVCVPIERHSINAASRVNASDDVK